MKKMIKAATRHEKLTWDELNSANQVAVEYAIQFINYENMDIQDAVIRAVDQVNNAYDEPEYELTFWEEFEGEHLEASKNVVRYYIEDHPELINRKSRSVRRNERRK